MNNIKNLIDLLENNGFETSDENIKILSEGLLNETILVMNSNNVNLNENDSLDYQYMKLLDQNGFTTTKEDIDLLKEAINNNLVLFEDEKSDKKWAKAAKIGASIIGGAALGAGAGSIIDSSVKKGAVDEVVANAQKAPDINVDPTTEAEKTAKDELNKSINKAKNYNVWSKVGAGGGAALGGAYTYNKLKDKDAEEKFAEEKKAKKEEEERLAKEAEQKAKAKAKREAAKKAREKAQREAEEAREKAQREAEEAKNKNNEKDKDLNESVKNTNNKKRVESIIMKKNELKESITYYVDLLEENGFETSIENIELLLNDLREGNTIILPVNNISLCEGMNPDYIYMQILDQNGYIVNENNLEVIKNAIENGHILLTESDKKTDAEIVKEVRKAEAKKEEKKEKHKRAAKTAAAIIGGTLAGAGLASGGVAATKAAADAATEPLSHSADAAAEEAKTAAENAAQAGVDADYSTETARSELDKLKAQRETELKANGENSQKYKDLTAEINKKENAINAKETSDAANEKSKKATDRLNTVTGISDKIKNNRVLAYSGAAAAGGLAGGTGAAIASAANNKKKKKEESK